MAIVREVSNLPDGINPNPDVHIPTARESSPSLASRFVATGGIITTSAPAFEGTQTWNNGAVTFTGAKLNVTDTASAAASLLMDLQVGGVSKASVAKDGAFSAQGTINSAGHLRATGGGSVQINSNTGALAFGTTADVFLTRDAANTLALRNGTAAQAFNVYNTYTDGSNYERGVFGWNNNLLTIGTEDVGTGADRGIQFRIGGNDRWQFTSAGNLIANSDNAFDIGASGANRPRNVYVASSVVSSGAVIASAVNGFQLGASGSFGSIGANSDGVFRFQNNAASNSFTVTASGGLVATFGGGVTAGASVTIPSSSSFIFGARGSMFASADGVVAIRNNAATDFTRLILGTNDASGVAIKKSSTAFHFVLGDDSAFASIIASYVKTTTTTVGALLPAATAGAGSRRFVTDANATMAAGIGTTVVGGGANSVPVYSDGTNWLIG